MSHHEHDPATRRPLHDARGIYCGQVCKRCEASVKSGFRAEIFDDPNYEATEAIEDDA